MSATKRLLEGGGDILGPRTTDPCIPYLTGFFDGEGSIRYTNTPELRITNTDLEILVVFWRRWGGSVVRTVRGTQRHRTQYVWSVCGDRACQATADMLEYLREKRGQAELLLLMRTLKPWERDDHRKTLSDMKHVDDLEREETILASSTTP